MDQDSIDRIRGATFPVARRGYDKREVERFLGKLADWLEGGGADESRSDLVRRELERVGEKTKEVLTAAEDAAEELRSEGERVRAEAAREAENAREAASQEAERTIAGARAEAQRIAEGANRKRAEIEMLISDLEARRDAVVAEVERLADEVTQMTTPAPRAGEGEDRPRAAQREAP